MTMTETETMTTDEVLAAMLTENTGRHMLDSGGAYGRNFERNGGKTVADFRAAPEVVPVTSGRYAQNDAGQWAATGETVVDYVNLDVFHFLSNRLDFDAELDAAFRAFAMEDERKDESWFACAEEWFEVMGFAFSGGGRGDGPYTVNTYNGEDNLSQIIQYTMFDHPETDEPMVALSIHGGCDARGGYTAPRMFRAFDHFSLWDNADLTVVLTEPDASPEAVAQAAMFPEYPTPVGGREVIIDYRGGDADRSPEPWNDDSLDVIDFLFTETPITVDETTGTMTIASGPAAGWEVAFYPPHVS